MKKLVCKDIDPSTTCEFMAKGETEEEVMDEMMEHAKEHHADKMEEMGMSEEEMKNMMKSKIKEE